MAETARQLLIDGRIQDSGSDGELGREPETLPRRGYRFIVPVEATGNGQVARESTESEAAGPRKRFVTVVVALSVCVLLTIAGWFAYKIWRATVPPPPV
jgi:DNA-binding winged helix-turn-helix (wHTH) protein